MLYPVKRMRALKSVLDEGSARCNCCWWYAMAWGEGGSRCGSHRRRFCEGKTSTLISNASLHVQETEKNQVRCQPSFQVHHLG